jgi:hypothetical protein
MIPPHRNDCGEIYSASTFTDHLSNILYIKYPNLLISKSIVITPSEQVPSLAIVILNPKSTLTAGEAPSNFHPQERNKHQGHLDHGSVSTRARRSESVCRGSRAILASAIGMFTANRFVLWPDLTASKMYLNSGVSERALESNVRVRSYTLQSLSVVVSVAYHGPVFRWHCNL